MAPTHELRLPPLLSPSPDSSPLQTARLHRKLTREEAAKRAELSPEEVAWLEEGRLYRFPSANVAVSAVLAYSHALGIDRREALELAGRSLPPTRPDSLPRILGAAALAALLAVIAVALADARLSDRPGDGRDAQKLPPPWRISVDVLNGSGDINHTRRVADKLGSLAYHIASVRRADRFDYPETAVYYPPGGEAIAARLAGELGIVSKPLPGGGNPRRLIVIVGPATIAD
jgi:transcriptional regulator with XRE-family HTH domain